MKCEKYVQRLPAVQSPKSNTDKKNAWLLMQKYLAFGIQQDMMHFI
jgi:hypothetical protein